MTATSGAQVMSPYGAMPPMGADMGGFLPYMYPGLSNFYPGMGVPGMMPGMMPGKSAS